MATYQQTGSTIGNLLRAIQEEKSQSPLTAQPTAEIGSPIRDLVQEPVFQPESPDSSRIAQIRPGIEQQAEVGAAGAVVPPLQPLPPQSGEVVAPAAPNMGPSPVAPTNVGNAPAPSAPRSVAPPSLATRISSVPSASVSARSSAPVKSGQVAGVSVKAAAPKAPIPTPTPTQNRSNTAAKVGAASLGTVLSPSLLDSIGQRFFKFVATPTKLLQDVVNRYKYATSRQA